MNPERIKKFDAAVAVTELQQAPKNPVDIKMLMGHVLREFGGLEEFAKIIFKQWEALPPKSPARERLLSNLMRLIATATTQGPPEIPIADDDLEAELDRKLKELYGTNGQSLA